MDKFGEPSLVSRAKAGDQEAFTIIFDNHKDEVYGYALRKLGGRQEAEDVVQEVFLKVWQSLQNFQDGRSMSAWISKICSYTVNDHLRRYYRNLKLRRELESFFEPNEEMMSDQNDQNSVQEIMSNLSENQRTVLILSNLQNKSRSEIAMMLFHEDTPESRKKVSDLLYRASQTAKKLSDRVNG